MTAGRWPTGERGATPVVGKALEAAIVVLFIGLLTTVLYGGVVPEYRSAAGAEVGDRVLATASQEIQGAVPESPVATARAPVQLPKQIRGDAYRIRTTGTDPPRLVLEHPHPSVDGSIPLVLPDDVVTVDGSWTSTEASVVEVRQTEDGRVVELHDGDQS